MARKLRDSVIFCFLSLIAHHYEWSLITRHSSLVTRHFDPVATAPGSDTAVVNIRWTHTSFLMAAEIFLKIVATELLAAALTV